MKREDERARANDRATEGERENKKKTESELSAMAARVSDRKAEICMEGLNASFHQLLFLCVRVETYVCEHRCFFFILISN